jgi:hypothetical protein
METVLVAYVILALSALIVNKVFSNNTINLVNIIQLVFISNAISFLFKIKEIKRNNKIGKKY